MFCEVCGKPSSMQCSECQNAWYYLLASSLARPSTNARARCSRCSNAEHAARPKAKPPKGRCTGCNLKFSEASGDYCEDDCPNCGYQACESCVSHHSRGTCYCPNSNFGRSYCIMDPAWYHGDGRTGKSYDGDRHPQEDYEDEVYETEPRKRGNCGEVTRLFKKEYLRAN